MGLMPTKLRKWIEAGSVVVREQARPKIDATGWGLLYVDQVSGKLRIHTLRGGDRTLEPAAGGGSGDVVGPSSSVASEVALFDGTTGKLIKRAAITGLAKLTSGVLSAAAAGTDYYAPGSTDVAVADGGTGSSTAAGARTNLGLGTMAVEAVTLSTQGDILYRDGSGLARLAAGTAGQRLRTGGSGANPAWADLLGFYGDGSDGSLNFDGAATVLGMAPSGGVYTFTREVYATDVTVGSGVRLALGSYALYVQGTLTGTNSTSFISANGNDASGSTAGAGQTATAPFAFSGVGGGAGRTGTTGGGTNGSGQSNSPCGSGGAGGGAPASGGSAGVASPVVDSRGGSRALDWLLRKCRYFDGASVSAAGGGCGGGGGALNHTTGTGNGGGGGGGARAAVVFARSLAGTGYIEANGGNGANASATGADYAGGGGGGGGGLAALVTSTPSSSWTVRANGGTFGTGAGGGNNGNAGSAGLALTFIL